MGTHSDNVFVIVMWAIVGLLLSPLLLIGLVGGLLLGFMLIPILVPMFLIVAAIVVALKGGPAEGAVDDVVAVEPAIEGISVLEEAEAIVEAAATPVTATVVGKEGICPIAPCEIGETWKMNGKWTGPESLCFFGDRLLSKKAAQLRSGEIPDGELFECQGRDFRLVFQIRRAEELETTASV